SKVMSLRGGVLQPTPLMTFSTQGDVREYLKQNNFGTVSDGNRLLRGHDVVIAKGPIQAALTGKDDAAAESDQPLKRGYGGKGGRMMGGGEMSRVHKPDQGRSRGAEQVGAGLNELFPGGKTAGSRVAIAGQRDLIAVGAPPRYRLNRPHYMRVVWAVPLAPP